MNYDPTQLWEGVCFKEANGKPYAYRVFKAGQLQIEKLYQFETSKVYSEFKRLKKDSIIAELTYGQEGSSLELKQTYYLNRQGKRCWREENYRQGKLWQVRYFQTFTNEELVKAGYATRPEHLIDAEGYCDVSAQFGKETVYYPNGKVMSVSEHQLIVSDSPNYYPSKHGDFVLYAENGVEIERGTYANGQQNGDFVYHHLNGKLAAKKSFENGIAVGNWIEYYDDGNLRSTIEYGEQFYWPSGHEKHFFESGNLQFEKMIGNNGQGFKTEYYADGKLKERIVYEHGPSEQSAYYSWFPNGSLQRKTYYRAKNDTVSAEFYPDGFLKSINLQERGYQYQEQRSYFENHQLERESIVDVVDGLTHQKQATYSDKGIQLTVMQIDGKKRIFKEYWNDGKLKFEKQFDDNLLNGYWIEQDSLGNMTKKCHYTNGFKDLPCEVEPKYKLERLTKEQKSAVLPLTIQQITRIKYSGNVIIDEEAVDLQAELVKRALQFLMSNYSTFELRPFRDSITDFRYMMYTNLGLYETHKKSVDSIFSVLNWKSRQKIQTQGQNSFGRFSSTKLYSPMALDSIFKRVFPEGSHFITLEVNAYAYPDLEYYGAYENAVFLERKEAEKAWLVSINNTSVVLYDDGMCELYNGSEVVVHSPYLINKNVNNFHWEKN